MNGGCGGRDLVTDSTRCDTPGECVPSCNPECFKAKLRTIRLNIGKLKGARQ
jgi:hypothetical protein